MKSQAPSQRPTTVSKSRLLFALTLAVLSLALLTSPRQLVSALHEDQSASPKAARTRPAMGPLPGMAPVPQTCAAPPSGMLSWWPGEGNANDIQGTNNGTLQNGVGFAAGEVP